MIINASWQSGTLGNQRGEAGQVKCFLEMAQDENASEGGGDSRLTRHCFQFLGVLVLLAVSVLLLAVLPELQRRRQLGGLRVGVLLVHH